MALQSSGAIKLSEIQTEFGGSNPISLSEYYDAATGVPASGTISISDFYDTQSFSPYTLVDIPNSVAPSNWYTLQIVDYGVYDISNQTTTWVHGTGTGINNSWFRFLAGVERSGYYVAAGGWDVRLKIDLSSVPENSRSGRIKLTSSPSYASADYGSDADEHGYSQYKSASGSFVTVLGPYTMNYELDGKTRKYGDYLDFTTTDSVQDYLDDQSGILELRIRHTTDNGWYGPNSIADDWRIVKIEIIE